MAQVLQLSADERRRFLTLLEENARGPRVADVGAPYGMPDPTSGVTQLQGSRDMKSLTVVLPDDLIKQAQAAGLLADGRLEYLIRRALDEQQDTGRTMSASSGKVAAGRRLIRQNGHLVVEALEGERPVSDADVKDALDRMEW